MNALAPWRNTLEDKRRVRCRGPYGVRRYVDTPCADWYRPCGTLRLEVSFGDTTDCSSMDCDWGGGVGGRELGDRPAAAHPRSRAPRPPSEFRGPAAPLAAGRTRSGG